jgi:DNA-directed RNA polymerase specialized sigma24 family protein
MIDEGLTLREAAIRLGASEGAIRKRVARGHSSLEVGRRRKALCLPERRG